MDRAYPSCEWIEGGLAFNRRSLHTCLIVHHHTGLPFVAGYNGGALPLEALFALREQIRTANRDGSGHPACRGCPHLRTQNGRADNIPSKSSALHITRTATSSAPTASSRRRILPPTPLG